MHGMKFITMLCTGISCLKTVCLRTGCYIEANSAQAYKQPSSKLIACCLSQLRTVQPRPWRHRTAQDHAHSCTSSWRTEPTATAKARAARAPLDKNHRDVVGREAIDKCTQSSCTMIDCAPLNQVHRDVVGRGPCTRQWMQLVHKDTTCAPLDKVHRDVVGRGAIDKCMQPSCTGINCAPLDKVHRDVVGRGAVHAAVDVVPRLPRQRAKRHLCAERVLHRDRRASGQSGSSSGSLSSAACMSQQTPRG